MADIQAQGNDAKEAPEVEQPQADGRLPTIYEESDVDLASHIMKVRRAELQDEKGSVEATPIDKLYTGPTHMITDNSALATVAEEQRGRLPTK
eukprot:2909324-Pyramimonas_sp.AAC.1